MPIVGHAAVDDERRSSRTLSTLVLVLAAACLACSNPERPPRGATGSNRSMGVGVPHGQASPRVDGAQPSQHARVAAKDGRRAVAPDSPPPNTSPTFYASEREPIWQLAATPDHFVYVFGYSRKLRPGWAKAPEPAGVRAFALDPNTPERVVAAATGGLSISDDFGKTWQPIAGPADAEITALAIDGDGRIHAATRRHGLRVHDGGGWSTLAPERLPAEITAVAAGPGAGQPLYVAAPPNLVLRSDDRGRTWNGSELFDDRGDPLPVATLLVGGEQGETLHALAAQRLLRSEDGGKRFMQLRLPGKLPALSAAVLRGNDALIAAGTAAGLFVSRDKGESWAMHYQGLPETRVEALALREVRRQLETVRMIAVGNGEGLFVLSLDSAGVDGTGAPSPQASHVDRGAIRTVAQVYSDALPSGDPGSLAPDALVATAAQQRAAELAAAETRTRYEALDRALESASYAQRGREFERTMAREASRMQTWSEAVARSRALCSKIRAGYKPTHGEIEMLIRQAEELGAAEHIGSDQWASMKRSMRAAQ